MTLCQVGLMPGWQNINLTKCQVDKMHGWQNARLTKCQVDKTSIWQKARLTKGQVDKMPGWSNARLTKCQFYKMSDWQNVLAPNIHLAWDEPAWTGGQLPSLHPFRTWIKKKNFFSSLLTTRKNKLDRLSVAAKFSSLVWYFQGRQEHNQEGCMCEVHPARVALSNIRPEPNKYLSVVPSLE